MFTYPEFHARRHRPPNFIPPLAPIELRSLPRTPAPDARIERTFTGALPKAHPPIDPLETEKEKHAKILQELNGSYFQDPYSPLKQAWDAVVKKIPHALHLPIEHRFDLNPCLPLLETGFTKDYVDAKSAINRYLLLEMQRDTSEAIFKKIVCIQKSGYNATYIQRSLEGQKRLLQERQKELCGDHYEDPTSLLDIKWKEYQHALHEGSPNANTLFNEFLTHDEERKENDSRLYFLDQQLSFAATSSEEPLPGLFAIQRKIETLHGSPQEQELLTGAMDWRKTAATAHRLTLWRIASDLLTRS